MVNSKHKKQFFSESIYRELDWVSEIQDKDTRWRFWHLEHPIALSYTYYVYHGYSVKDLAEIYKVPKRQIVIWILIGAYTLRFSDFRFENGTESFEQYLLYKQFPKVKETLPCSRCVWADTRTGRVICFRKCKGYNSFQSK